MKTIIFFNIKGGVGKTTLAYHTAYMFAELGHRCLAVDLDPQANLTAMFLPDSELERIYSQDRNRETLISGIRPSEEGVGDIAPVKVHEISNNIGLLAGDLDLAHFEDALNLNWGKCLNGDEAALRMVTSIYRIIQNAAKSMEAEYCIIDVSPTFTALNRSAMISADFVVVPVSADQYSIHGIQILGNKLNMWRSEWKELYEKNKEPEPIMPTGEMKAIGYIVTSYRTYQNQPVMPVLNWINKIPAFFHEYVLCEKDLSEYNIDTDTYCLALLKHYHSLIPMAMEVRKPIFLLKPADGAIGAHYQAVLRAYQDFKALSEKILKRTRIKAGVAVKKVKS